VSPHKMIRSRLGCRVWAIGRVLGPLGKGRIIRPQRSVDLVGGDVQKTKCRFLFRGQSRPVSPRLFQQTERSIYVGANKIVRPMNRPINVALGGKMNNRARAM